jgi:DNA repair exonuclease SbcCD ATPase subunit
MSDASDAVALAVARTQRLAASRLVRKEEIGTELERRRRDRASLEALPASDEVTSLKADVDARIAALTTELAAVDGELSAARAELAKLKKLAADAPIAEARAVVAAATAEPDPILRTPEETALANAREHIADLEAQARVNKELADATTEPAAPKPDPTNPSPPKKTF